MQGVRSRAREVARTLLRRAGVDARRPPGPLLRNPDAQLTVTLDHLIATRLLEGSDLFFVQIGAFDGQTGDQIHDYVVRYGWRGILVEPHPRSFAELERTYHGHDGLVLRNVAVSDRAETRALYAIRDEPGLPEWVPQIATFDRRRLEATPYAHLIEEHDVACVPLRELLAGVDHVDLLQVDVEGYDAEVIRMFEFDRYRPSIVRFENTTLTRADHDMAVERLVSYGYRLAVVGVDTIAWHGAQG